MNLTVFEYGTDRLSNFTNARVVYIGPATHAAKEESEVLSSVRFRMGDVIIQEH